MQQKLTVVVAGDLCMREPLKSLLGSKFEDSVFKGVSSILDDADVRLINLENPLIDEGIPIRKSGPNLCGPESGVAMLAAGGFDAAILANNHIGDYGAQGVFRTMAILDENGIGHVGAGANHMEARKPWIIKRNGYMLAVLASAENEFGTATDSSPGSNGINMRKLCSDIENAKNEADFVLVVMHGGNEYNPVPAPVVVDRYRRLIDSGADAVIGMHPHCPQGFEFYQNKPIVYSTGNFLFCRQNKNNPYDSWYHGYLPRIVFGDSVPEMTLHPYRFTMDGRHIDLLAGEEKTKMMSYLERISAIINDPEKLINHYESWCIFKGQEFDKSIRYNAKDRLTDVTMDKRMLDLRNAFTCEAHNDLFKTYLKILCDGRLESCVKGIPDILELQKMPK